MSEACDSLRFLGPSQVARGGWPVRASRATPSELDLGGEQSLGSECSQDAKERNLQRGLA